MNSKVATMKQLNLDLKALEVKHSIMEKEIHKVITEIELLLEEKNQLIQTLQAEK